jgi:hypothetical protein
MNIKSMSLYRREREVNPARGDKDFLRRFVLGGFIHVVDYERFHWQSLSLTTTGMRRSRESIATNLLMGMLVETGLDTAR